MPLVPAPVTGSRSRARHHHVAVVPPPPRKPPPSLACGDVLGIANPKPWLAISAVFAGRPATRQPGRRRRQDPGMTLMIIVICTEWLTAGALTQLPMLRDPRKSRITNIILAILLVTATAATAARQFPR